MVDCATRLWRLLSYGEWWPQPYFIPLLIKQNKWVCYKSFSLPANYRQITFYRSRKSPTFTPTSLRHLLPTFTSRNGRINCITKVVTHWYSEVLLSDTLPTFVTDKSPTFTPTFTPTLHRHLHRHSVIISSIICTVFRDKNKKPPTSQPGVLLQRYFMMEFQISWRFPSFLINLKIVTCRKYQK